MPRVELIIQPPERDQRIVLLIEIALLTQNVLRNGDASRERIELHGVRNRQQVFLGRAEEKQSVFENRSAEGSAELMLRVAAAVVAERVGRGEVPIAILVESAAVILIRSRLRHYIHISRIGASDLRRSSIQHHLKLTNGHL